MCLYLGPSGPQSSLPRAPATQPTCRNPGLSKTCGQDSSPLEAVMFAKGPLMKHKETGTRGHRKGSCYENNDITILTKVSLLLRQDRCGFYPTASCDVESYRGASMHLK